MTSTRKNPTRIALLVAAVMSLGTAGIAAAQPGQGNGPAVAGKRAGKNGKAHKGKRGQRMLRFDTNKDGVISPAEKNAMLRTRFANLDLNKDGVLVAAELQKAHAARMQGKNGQAWKNKNRGNKAGKRGKARKDRKAVTPAQRQARFAQRFARLDVNKDGRVTFAEFASAHSGKGPGHKMHKRGKRGQRGQRGQQTAPAPKKATLIKARVLQQPMATARVRAQYGFRFSL